MNDKSSYDIIMKNDYTEDDLNIILSEKYTMIIDNVILRKFCCKYFK